MYDTQKNMREIARSLGIPRSRVRSMIIKAGKYHPRIRNLHEGGVPCRKCRKEYPVESYTLGRSDGHWICPACSNEILHNYSIKKVGCTPNEYARLFAMQKGLCAICKTSIGHKSKNGRNCKLAVDHDHKTGIVRGLLCNGCNRGIARFKDSPELLRAAAQYLESEIHRGGMKR
jgi:hypothetical protein